LLRAGGVEETDTSIAELGIDGLPVADLVEGLRVFRLTGQAMTISHRPLG
jgi:hypothetical protein